MSWLPSPEYADWWYDLSWKGIIAFGAIAAFAGAATVVFTVLQFWSDGVRDERTDARNRVMEVQLAGANARIQEAEQKAKEADLARVKIEEKLAPRRMTQIGQNSVSAAISKFSGIVGGIGSSPRDIESMRLENAIHAAVSDAGWKLDRAFPTHTPMWPGGVHVSSTVDLPSQKAGVALALALDSVGLFATFGPTLEASSPQVFVTIGPKPDPDDPLLKLNRDSLRALAAEIEKK